jgi:hypothetical protein
MRKFISNFALRGLVACGFGPVVLAIIYIALYLGGVIETLPVTEVCVGIFSISALAFICGGMTAIYQVEKIHIMTAILLHGGVLYAAYLVTYLINNWLEDGLIPFLVFSGIFAVGYAVIWTIIYLVNRNRIAKINVFLKNRQDK